MRERRGRCLLEEAAVVGRCSRGSGGSKVMAALRRPRFKNTAAAGGYRVWLAPVLRR